MAALVLWGVSDFFATVSSRANGAMRTAFYALAFGTPFVLAFAFIQGVGFPNAGDAFLAFVSGVPMMVGFVLFLKALEKGKASIVGPISSAFGLFTALLAFAFLGEPLRLLGGLGLLALAAGFVLASAKPGSRGLATGVSLSVSAALCWGIGFYFSSLLADSAGASAALVYTSIANLTCIYVICVFMRADLRIPTRGRDVIVAIALLNLTANYAYLAGVAVDFVSLVAPISSAYPVVTVLLAHFFLRERLAAGQYAGIAFILLGVILLSL